jgi:mitochondrial import inner membrane translocase subunit TIM16
VEAYRQAQASQKFAASGSKNPSAARTYKADGLTLEEACKILDVPPPKEGKTDMTRVSDRFKRLFDTNDPKKGGSFYLQSKILRARQRIEDDVRDAAEKMERASAKPWAPKIYKDK